MLTAAERVTKAIAALVMDHYFFGSLVMTLIPKEDYSSPTFWTDGKFLGYNPDYVQTLNDQEMIGVMAHEGLHPGLLHHLRRKQGGYDHNFAVC